MKKVLVVHFSQSGQLTQIIKNITDPLIGDQDVEVNYYDVAIQKEFPFPWDKASFFDAFPESFLQIPYPLKDSQNTILHQKYDLVILGYQVWYLSPSIPINSFLKSEEAKKIFKNTPVVTVIGARNMWALAQEKVKKQLQDLGAILKGNIALVDRNSNYISVITIVQWMFSGKKEKYLGIFPEPGVSKTEIESSNKFGIILLSFLKDNTINLQKELIKKGAVEIRPFLIEMDQKANKMFKIWANFILKKQQSRLLWLKAFNYYLFIAIWFISPLVYLIYLLKRPFIKNKIKKLKTYYQGV
ncbi:dialkylrecorsinol condensing enzyme DarA [Flavobacterium columnare]|uniref:Dialkylresorcinol condensing enzyme DarA n=1 Tax=Flavobacterium columnare TaxID=996 RepID=A0AAI8CIS2_9FLAO|nr:dialkylrecorsinol condensing enzyme DarA [Flavobacterium columnare]AMO20970.1 dialkylresorcinol condensing enzyme DarA [Flavobacterium columnare]AUX18969.1 dialkylrecorsinol condensing enzyme DarA [Flavobacterium columnare]QOG58050.1 dialkylresorcinol condensing enzyme DarA [Flavobacterium columnare]QOG60772.1 dialkylresorcinol condensing enzyme DarA [Flavobacterium columnare]QOG63492.1 dialkylresorcinol condensing enzyme DarA [Flavobacterium columnare]